MDIDTVVIGGGQAGLAMSHALSLRGRHTRGATAVPGAYFLGLPLLHKVKSSFLSGVGDDAAWIAEHIDSHRPRCRQEA